VPCAAGRIDDNFTVDFLADHRPADRRSDGYFILADIRFQRTDQLIFDFFSAFAAMLLLLQPVHLSYSSLPWPVGVCREADC